MDIQKELTGVFDIVFVSHLGPTRVLITRVIQTAEGVPIYLEGPDGMKFNWSTILFMNPVKGKAEAQFKETVERTTK